MRFLRQSTAATVLMGPFVDKSDAVTEKTALSSQTGRIVKNGTGAALTPSSWTHDANGNYLVGLSTSHTDTVGRLRVSFLDSTTYLPVWADFHVLSAAVYDVVFGTVAPSTLAASDVSGAILATPTNKLATDGSGQVTVGGYAAGQAPLQPTVAGRTLDVSATGEAGLDWANVGSPTTTVNLSGTTISTLQQVASVSGAVGSVTGAVGSVAGLTTSTIAAAVWDQAVSGHTTSGTFGAAVNAAGSAGDPWSTPLPGSYGAGTAGSIVGTRLDAAVSTRSTYAGADTAGTTTLLARLGSALTISGGAVTLTAAYDPAKTAAQAGDAMALTPSERTTLVAAVFAFVTEGTTTFVQAVRGICSAAMGKASGLATATAKYRDLGDTKDRLTATVDSDGNRTAVTRDLT